MNISNSKGKHHLINPIRSARRWGQKRKYWQNSDAQDTCHIWNIFEYIWEYIHLTKSGKLLCQEIEIFFLNRWFIRAKTKMSMWNVMNDKVWYAIIAYNTETYLNKWPLQLESGTLYWT